MTSTGDVADGPAAAGIAGAGTELVKLLAESGFEPEPVGGRRARASSARTRRPGRPGAVLLAG